MGQKPSCQITEEEHNNRFNSYVELIPFSDCHHWIGNISKRGRARFGVGKKQIYASRYIWEKNKGPIPNRLCVCHTCDNPACVNINHLFIGSQKTNVKDMINKNRSWFQRKKNVGIKVSNRY